MTKFKEFDDRVEAHEPLWKWKVALRIFTTVLCIAAMAMVGWLISWSYSLGGSDNGYNYGLEDTAFIIVFMFIPLGLSIVWAAIIIPTILFKKGGIHPGFPVGFDLVLWLIFAVLGGIYVSAAGYASSDLSQQISALSSGSFSASSYSASSNSYYGSGPSSLREGYPYPTSAPSSNRAYTYYNNTDDCGPRSSSYSTESISCSGGYDSSGYYTAGNSTGVYRAVGSPDWSCPYFPSCAEQRQVLSNAADQLNSQRVGNNVYLAASIFLLIIMFFHFALFVWACIDCSRHNAARKADKDERRAKAIAAEMVRQMDYRNAAGNGGGPGYNPYTGGPATGDMKAPVPAHPANGFYAPPAQWQPPMSGANGNGYAPVAQNERAPQLPPLGGGVQSEDNGVGSSSSPPGILQNGSGKGKGKEHAYSEVPQGEESEHGESSTAGRIQWDQTEK